MLLSGVLTGIIHGLVRREFLKVIGAHTRCPLLIFKIPGLAIAMPSCALNPPGASLSFSGIVALIRSTYGLDVVAQVISF